MTEKENKKIKEENKDLVTTESAEEKAVPETEVKNEKADVKETKKEKKDERPKKNEAIARGVDVPISMKHSVFICDYIRGKKVDEAVNMLTEVIKMKKAVPFRGEIPHRKGRMMSGRYPINASKQFILILKGLKGNIVLNGLNLEKTRIEIASATWGRRPTRKGGKRAKRTNITLIAREEKK